MKHRNTLDTIILDKSATELMNMEKLSRFIDGGDEDYFLSRILLLLGFKNSGMYHYQQCIEKYLKAFVIKNNLKCDLFHRGGHDLLYLVEICGKFDTFFTDKDLVSACKKATPFEVVGRYPQNKVRAYGWVMPDLINFLDEFVHEVRKKIEMPGTEDLIEKIKKLNKLEPLPIPHEYSRNFSNLFFFENPYFKK